MARRAIDFRKWYSVPAWGLYVFLALDVWGLVLGAPLYFQTTSQASTASTSKTKAQPQTPPAPFTAANLPTGTDLDVKYERLSALLNSTEKRLDNLQKLLAALVTVGTIFGFAVGLSTYFNLKEIQKNAEDSVKKLLADANKDLDEIRADFPAIGHMNRAIDHILSELQRMFHEWDSGSYAQMSEIDRQEILVAEMTFSSLRLFGHHKIPASRVRIANTNRGFGLFYGGRSQQSSASDSTPHFQRAVMYLNRASDDEDPEVSAAAYEDLGVIYSLQSTREADPARSKFFRDSAKNSFASALLKNSSKPGSLIGQAWLQKRDGDLQKAIASLTKVIEKRDWQEQERRRHLLTARFNRACYLTLVGLTKQGKERTDQFQKALYDLNSAKALSLQYKQQAEFVSNLDREIGIGDLAELQTAYPAEIEEIRKF